MNTRWQVGDKAACIDDSDGDALFGLGEYLVKGRVYLVSGVYWRQTDGALLLSLAPFTNMDCMGWRSNRVRKLVPASEVAAKWQEGGEDAT